MKRAHKILATSLFALLLPGAILARADDATCQQPGVQPLLLRSSPNKLPNPHVAGGANWTLGGSAKIDATVSRTTDGSGSIDLSVPGSFVQSFPIPVTPGTTYTFSAYLQSTDWPTLAYMVIGIRDSSQKYLTTVNTDRQGTTTANQWQEIAVTYTPRPGDAFVNLQVGRMDASQSPSVAGKMWVDDFYFGEGISFEQSFSPKIPFDGGMVKVDELGNFTVLTNGDWTPYFPFCVYGDRSPDFQPYSDQGFNCLMRNWFVRSILERAKNAVSAFNPNGMMSLLEITQYLLPADTQTYNNLSDLSAGLARVMQSPLLGNVLGFYWDNEEYNQYDVPRAVTELVKQSDTLDGTRLHPIYMLNGSQTDSRVYGQLTDVLGDYLSDGPRINGTRQPSTWERFSLLYNLEGQSRPVGIAIISEEAFPEGLRRKVYQGLIAGVKGIAYYVDGTCDVDYNGPPEACKDMKLRVSWNEFPLLRGEIDQLMPLIRQPHWTAWKVTSSDRNVQFGTRDYGCDGYLILLNPTSASITSTFTISGLAYEPSAVADYFTGETMAPISGGRFSVTVDANRTAVYHLSR